MSVKICLHPFIECCFDNDLFDIFTDEGVREDFKVFLSTKWECKNQGHK